MRLTLRFIFSILSVMVLIAFSFSAWQVHQEKLRLFGELERASNGMALQLQEKIGPLMVSGAPDAIQDTLDEFTSKQRLSGVVIHDEKGGVLFVSANFPGA